MITLADYFKGKSMGDTGFQWQSQADDDAYRTLNSLVKYNQGLFKSVAQSKFVRSGKLIHLWLNGQPDVDQFDREVLASKNYGVSLSNGQIMIVVNAYMRWVGYGAKSFRPCAWAFVIDASGIVAKYKFKFVGDMRKGTAIDPSKTVKEFERDSSLVLPDFEAVEKAQALATEAVNAAKSYVGVIGERSEFIAKVVSVKTFHGQSFGYGDSGLRTMTVLEDEAGNKLVYWNHVGSKGEKVRFKATVKAHSEYKGVKQTVLSRAKVLETFGGGEDQLAEEVAA
jgi:hypothetical protein